MEIRIIKVIINHVLVYEETVAADKSMMRGHQLRRLFCIDLLKMQGVWATVTKHTGDSVAEVHEVRIEGTEMVVQSKMNDESFEDSMDWFDDKIFVRKMKDELGNDASFHMASKR